MKSMKKVLSLVMVAILSFTMVGCNSSPTPTETADTCIKALQALDLGSFASVYDEADGEENIMSTLDEDDKQLLEDIKNSSIAKLLDFDYTLSNEKIDGEKATVDVKITTYSVEAAFKALIPKFFAFAMSEEAANMKDDQLTEKVLKMVEAEMDKITTKDYTTTATINLVQRDGEWKVAPLDNNEKLLNGLTGGLMDLANNMDKYL